MSFLDKLFKKEEKSVFNQTNNTKPKGKITVESSTHEVKNITKYLRDLLDIAEDLAMDSAQLRKLDEMIDRFEIVSKQKTTKETIAVDKLILNIAELFKAQCVNQSISGASYYLGVLNSLLKDRASGVSTKYSSPKYCEITLKYHKLQAEVRNYKADIDAKNKEIEEQRRLYKEGKVSEEEALDTLDSLMTEVEEKEKFSPVLKNKEKILTKIRTIIESSTLLQRFDVSLDNDELSETINEALEMAKSMSLSDKETNRIIEKLDSASNKCKVGTQDGIKVGTAITGETTVAKEKTMSDERRRKLLGE